MKKILSIIILAIIFSPCLSAFNFFSDRFFEINTNIPVSFSNNILPIKDIFQKELKIDLRSIADSTPSEGFNAIINTSPALSMNIRTPVFHFGLSTGIDIYNKMTISKDLFDFLGYGNEIGKELNVAVFNNSDIYLHADVTMESKFKNNRLRIKPSIFIPLLSTSGKMGSLSFLNDENGKINLNLATDANIYTCFDLSTIFNDGDSIFNDVSAILDTLKSELFNNSGFDMELEYSKNLSSEVTLGARLHFPIVPGKITNLINYSLSSSISTSLSEINSLDLGSVGSDLSNINTAKNSEVLIQINRPFKFMGYVNYNPWNSIFLYELGLGIGVRHPGVDGSYSYFEYYVASSFNLAGIFAAKLSTEYTNEVFKHQIQTKLNLRICEVDLGVSLESATLAKSFSTAGFGAFVSVSSGF